MDATENNQPADTYAKYENKTAREKRNQLLKFRKSHAFVIGINHYPRLTHLYSAVPDAERIAAVLWDDQGFDQVWLIRDIRGAEFKALLQWIGKKGKGRIPAAIQPVSVPGTGQVAAERRKTIEANPGNRFIRYADSDEPMKISPDDSLLFYYAGHGKAGEFEKGPSGYLLPSDAEGIIGALQKESLISMDDLLTALQDAACKHTFLILDCCFAGKFRYAVKKTRSFTQLELRPMYAERFELYKRKAAWQVLVSAGPDETAADLGDRADQTAPTAGPHSPFALALFEALAGKADFKAAGKTRGDGVLTASELKAYIYAQIAGINAESKPQHPDLFPMEGHANGEFIFFDPTNPLNFPEREIRNPYKGLKAYEEIDAEFFFGRKDSTDAAFDYLKKGIVAMAISAPSGLGKSSFAKAGLYPKMKNELGFEDLLQMRPGQFPKTTFDKLKGLIKPGKKQVLLIDQYEELYTVCTDEKQRRDFESGLLELFNQASAGKSKIKILITIRSDYAWRLEGSALGKQLLEFQDLHFAPFRLAPLNLDQLREILVNPAEMLGFEFESPKLVDRILQEINYAPGALPLLSLAMSWLFQVVDKIRVRTDEDIRVFTTEHYNQLGGINKCLSKMADAVYKDLPDDAHRDMMRKILLRMVQLQEGGFVRRRLYLDESSDAQAGKVTYALDFPNDDQDRICRQVLNALEGNLPGKLEGINLLLRGSDENGREYVEPAHDSLINYWPRCLEWIDAFGKEQLILQRELWRAVEESMRVKANPDTATTGEVQDTGINTKISPFDEHQLWDTNRKLEQLFEQLLKNNQSNQEDPIRAAIGKIETALSGKDQEAFREFIKRTLAEDGKPDFDALIITGASGSLLDVLLDQGNHWFNQAEAAFIRKSWEKRTQGILRLKQERDEARATALIAVARRLEDPTVALNLALAAHGLYPSEECFTSLMELRTEPIYHQIFEGHSDAVYSVAFSPDGKYILTGSEDNTVRLWNIVDTDKPCQVFEGHSKAVCSVAFSPDGKYILTGSYDATARLWSIVDKDKPCQVFEGHWDGVMSVAFSRNGEYILTGSRDKTARLWNLQGVMIRPFEGHSGVVWSVAFSPNGESILTGSADKTARLWNIRDKTFKVFEGHSNFVISVAFSPDGESILTGSYDKTARLWNIKDMGKKYRVFEGHSNSVISVAFSPKGESILTSSRDKTARLWNIDNEDNTYQIFKGHNDAVWSVAFSPDGNYILTGSDDRTARLWNIENKYKPDRRFEGHSDAVWSVAFSPDGKSILTGSFDKATWLWDIEDKDKPCLVFEGHSNFVISVAFSPKGESILTGSADKTARLWNIKNGSFEVFKGHSKAVISVAFSPNGESILTGSADKTARLWNIEDKIFKVFEGHAEQVTSVAFSPDGEYILTGSYDKTARLWNIRDKTFKVFEGHTEQVTSVAFSPDGEYILTGSKDKTARLWNIEDKTFKVFEGHSDAVWSVAFSPDGEYILTGSYDKTARLWNINALQIQSFHGSTFRPISSVAFSPDGFFILFASGSASFLWPNLFNDFATGAIWNRCYKLNEEERQQYKITWDY